MKPSIGRTVVVKEAVFSNGISEHPAIITRVWSNEDPVNLMARVYVNLMVLPDMGRPTCVDSVRMFDCEADAYGTTPAAYWPPRI